MEAETGTEVLKPPKSFNASTPVSKDPSHHAQICSPNFTNISAIKKKEEVKDVRRMLATPEGNTADIFGFNLNLTFMPLDLDESYISLSKINHVSSSTNSSKESPEKPRDNEGPQNDNLTFTKKEKNDEDSQIKQSRENQELKQVGESSRNWNCISLFVFSSRQLRNKNADLNSRRRPLVHSSMSMSRKLRDSRRNTTRNYKKV